MYEVTMQLYNEKTDSFEPKGLRVPFLSLTHAKEAVREAHKETDNHYLITKNGDKSFRLWHDEIEGVI